MKASIATLVALVAATGVLAGCSGDEGTKAGGSAAPVTLRIGTNDTPGRAGAEQIEEFARRVAQLSDRKLRIQPVWEAPGVAQADWDQKVARMVVSGKLDLGMIPTRAFDTEGVTSLRALSAPFLVTSDELSKRVAGSELADEMLAGLDEIGLVGLALVPEGLRHPFAFGEPLLSPEDYDGALIRAPTSEVTDALFAALGGRSDDLAGTAFEEAIAASDVAAAESSFVWSTQLFTPTVATGNVTFFPKLNTIAMNAGAFEDLTDEQQAILRRAAEETRKWAARALPSDAEAAKLFCREGGTVVLASDDDIAALEKAAAPVYAELEQDPKTKSLITRIHELKTQLGVSGLRVKACSSEVPPVSAQAAGSTDPSFPDGIYRIEITDDDLRSGGVTNAGELLQNHGVYTWTLSRGTWSFDTRAPNRQNAPSRDGTYSVDGDRVTFVWADLDGPPPHQFRWSVESDGSLRLTPLGNPHPIVAVSMSAHPWTRIADAPAEEASFPEGVYRVSYTTDFLVEQGLDRPSAFDQAGVQTLTFENGGFLHEIKGKPPECRGTYAVEDGRVALVIAAGESPGCGSEDWEIFNARWTLEGDELRFLDVASKVDDADFAQIVWGSKPWRKIG